MHYSLDRGEQVQADLERIYDFLLASYVSFGDRPDIADANAAERVTQIENAMEALVDLPHQGTLHTDWMLGLRSVTKERAIFYFIVDDHVRVVRVLAVFFGGQDHHQLMLKRIMHGD